MPINDMNVYYYLEVFFLVFLRVTAFLLAAPIFGRRSIPQYYKIGLSFLISMVVIHKITLMEVVVIETVLDFVLIGIKEILVGIMLGYIGYICFTAIYFAGQMIDTQIGFGVVNVLDPQSNIQIPITANYYFITSMLIFLISQGHYIMIEHVFHSFELLPIGKATFNIEIMNNMIEIFGDIFVMGFKMFAPVIAVIIVTDVSLGIITKTVSQLNVFVIGMPLKLILGVGVILLTVPSFILIVERFIGTMDTEMADIIYFMNQESG